MHKFYVIHWGVRWQCFGEMVDGEVQIDSATPMSGQLDFNDLMATTQPFDDFQQAADRAYIETFSNDGVQ